MEYVVSEIGAAVDQLDWSIRLFLDYRAYVPAITLAGAAEEVLGAPLPEESALSLLKATLHKQSGILPRKISDGQLNRAKNWLKHGPQGPHDEAVYFELEEEALQLIVRAVVNLINHDNSVPSEAPRFFEWLYKNRPDILPSQGNS
jgi:hypothetical protein